LRQATATKLAKPQTHLTRRSAQADLAVGPAWSRRRRRCIRVSTTTTAAATATTTAAALTPSTTAATRGRSCATTLWCAGGRTGLAALALSNNNDSQRQHQECRNQKAPASKSHEFPPKLIS
jgi:hypothetical protein